MQTLPAAVLLLVLSAAKCQLTHQQADTDLAETAHPITALDVNDTVAISNHTLTATASELLSSVLVTLLSMSNSLAHSLPAAFDSLHAELSALSVSPVVALFTSATSSSAQHPHHDLTIPVLLFLIVALFVLLLVVSGLTLVVWQQYGASIATLRDDWHSTRARRRDDKAAKREKAGADEKPSSVKEEQQHTATPAAAAAVAGSDSSGGRQQSPEQLYGFMSRARAISEADDDVEPKTPTVTGVTVGRDPFSQIRRKN